MVDMKIGIIGAGGRMGQACIRQVTGRSWEDHGEITGRSHLAEAAGHLAVPQLGTALVACTVKCSQTLNLGTVWLQRRGLSVGL